MKLTILTLTLALAFVTAEPIRERRLLKDTFKKVGDFFKGLGKFSFKNNDAVRTPAKEAMALGEDLQSQVAWMNDASETYRALGAEGEAVSDALATLYATLTAVGKDAVSYNQDLLDGIQEKSSKLWDIFEAAVTYPIGRIWQLPGQFTAVSDAMDALKEAQPDQAADIDSDMAKVNGYKDVVHELQVKYAAISNAGKQ